MGAAAGRLRRRLGRRGLVLVLLGVGKVCYGIGVAATPPPSKGLDLLLRLAPLRAWSALWIAAGVVVFASAFVPVGRDWAGFLVACLPPIAWGVAYGTAAAEGIYPRGFFVFGWYMTSHIGVILWASAVPEWSIPHPDSEDTRRE